MTKCQDCQLSEAIAELDDGRRLCFGCLYAEAKIKETAAMAAALQEAFAPYVSAYADLEAAIIRDVAAQIKHNNREQPCPRCEVSSRIVQDEYSSKRVFQFCGCEAK